MLNIRRKKNFYATLKVNKFKKQFQTKVNSEKMEFVYTSDSKFLTFKTWMCSVLFWLKGKNKFDIKNWKQQNKLRKWLSSDLTVNKISSEDIESLKKVVKVKMTSLINTWTKLQKRYYSREGIYYKSFILSI